MKVKEKDEDQKEKREKLVKEEVPKAKRGNMDKLFKEVVKRIQQSLSRNTSCGRYNFPSSKRAQQDYLQTKQGFWDRATQNPR